MAYLFQLLALTSHDFIDKSNLIMISYLSQLNFMISY